MAIAIWNTRDVISLFQQYGASLLAATFSAWLCYMLSLVVYRLYLSPLAKFPGPKLAALTSWYEIYYNIFKKGGGQYIFKIKQMHEQYGGSTYTHKGIMILIIMESRSYRTDKPVRAPYRRPSILRCRLRDKQAVRQGRDVCP